MKRHRYLIIVPNGVGIRNFFCTPFIDLLLESGSVGVWHALAETDIAPFRDRWKGTVTWRELPQIRDGLAERVVRQAKIHAQLFWQLRLDPQTPIQPRKPPSRAAARAVERVSKLLGRLSAGPRRIVLLDRLHQALAARASHTRAFERLLRDERPDAVFCGHQKSLRAVPAMLAARRLGIPSATFIYSWDNLPKGRMPVSADCYFVWSEFMRDELVALYPDVSPDRVRVVGTPQFESYHDLSLLEPREDFLRKLGLDPARPVVCFSGDDEVTSPHDPVYLADLAEALRGIPAARRPQVLFRRSPVDKSPRFDAVLSRFPEIAVSDPLWRSEGRGDWASIVPTREDVALLANVVAHSDLVINVGSTMAMDFAAFDKPAIFIAYDPPERDAHWSFENIYRLPHFKTTHQLQPVHWARSREELAAVVGHALEHPAEKADARRRWLHLHVEQPMDQASRRLSDALRALASGETRREGAA
ncbi:MAG TPA: hypothetical protein VFS34_08965 [Thermoanaerobaculia bacterium]|nr:hypothetical protein [Thermoanaerobaculia bacterium]